MNQCIDISRACEDRRPNFQSDWLKMARFFPRVCLLAHTHTPRSSPSAACTPITTMSACKSFVCAWPSKNVLLWWRTHFMPSSSLSRVASVLFKDKTGEAMKFYMRPSPLKKEIKPIIVVCDLSNHHHHHPYLLLPQKAGGVVLPQLEQGCIM